MSDAIETRLAANFASDRSLIISYFGQSVHLNSQPGFFFDNVNPIAP
ncbi:MAG: hypothetical protein GDA48_02775 [Hormoscilla sp. GM102CHS1]|nr:hypothetical protein [Hormoscilla sp. GM102CHS1]